MKVAVLGAGLLQNYIIDAIHAKGYTAIAFDGNPQCASTTNADEFINLDFSDRESLLRECRKREIDGILTYASEAAAPVVSWVAEQMGLRCNPYDSVEILKNKDLTRTFLKENGFNVPKFFSTNDIDEARKFAKEMQCPFVIKPIDSCGSRGFSKIEDESKIEEAIYKAFENSKKKQIIFEEYIERKGYFLEVECYVSDGRIVYFEPMYQHRDELAPYSPIGDSLPIDRCSIDGKNALFSPSKDAFEEVRNELQRILDLLEMKFGIFNVEFIYDKSNKLYFMEIGPRAGGNLISEANYYSTGFDMRLALVSDTLGDKIDYHFDSRKKFVSCLLVHSEFDGIFDGIEFADDFYGKILDELWFVKSGDSVSKFTNGKYGLGLLIIEFANREEMLKVMDHSTKYIRVKLKK